MTRSRLRSSRKCLPRFTLRGAIEDDIWSQSSEEDEDEDEDEEWYEDDAFKV